MKEFKEFLGYLFLETLSITYAIMACGYLLYKTYYWFVVPVFSTPNINYSQAVGLTLFIGIIKPSIKRELTEDSYKESEYEHKIKLLIAPWVFLLLAWIVKLFI